MRCSALACDYDGTVADRGVLDPAAREALGRLRAQGTNVVLVTGRRLDDLTRVCPELRLFDAIVAENGAILHLPRSGLTRLLAAPPAPTLFEALRLRGVDPLVAGQVIVATTLPHEPLVRETIRSMGLNLDIVINKTAVMVLPAGVDKATGLGAALAELGLSARDVVAVGDAENDLALLACCGYAVAVGDAVPELKAAADLVTAGKGGAGVAELAQAMLADDFSPVSRRALSLGDATS